VTETFHPVIGDNFWPTVEQMLARDYPGAAFSRDPMGLKVSGIPGRYLVGYCRNFRLDLLIAYDWKSFTLIRPPVRTCVVCGELKQPLHGIVGVCGECLFEEIVEED